MFAMFCSFSIQSGLFQLPSCKVLQKSHVPFTEVGDIPYSMRGVYKIAYNYKTIYVGGLPCNLRQTLRNHFNGNGQKDLYEFIKSLSQRDLENISVYWLDENKHAHTCKKSYMKCVEELEGGKPMFNSPVTKPRSRGWCSIM